MKNQQSYAALSLELHLFFARIMKEHSLFLKAGFTPVDASFAKAAELYKQEFEKLLCNAIRLSDGIVSKRVLCSGELTTEFTACAEQQTQCFTGIAINEGLTGAESRLSCGEGAPAASPALCRQVKQLNQEALVLLNGLISLKEKTLSNVLCCKMFTMTYPLMLEHILREAKLYRTYVCCLENGMEFDCQTMKQIEQFWNQIMMEHALFMRGLLDPTENELIEASDSFAKDYARLLTTCRDTHDRTIPNGNTNGGGAALEETIKFRDFKAAGAKGIQTCKVRSIILPLLADHVLREANHYIRLLSD